MTMTPLALLAVLTACVLSTEAVSKCDESLIKEIKKNLKETPFDLKADSLLTNGEGLLAANTAFFFGVKNPECVTTKLGVDNTYSVTLYDIFGKATKQPVTKLEEDETWKEYYYKTTEGIKVYSIPFYNKDNVVGIYTCADQDPKKGQEDKIKDAAVKIRVALSGDSEKAQEVIKKAKNAVEEAKNVGQKYGFNWIEKYVVEDCLKTVKEAEKAGKKN